MKSVIFSIAAIGLLGGGAMAADLPMVEQAPIVAPVPVGFTWTGPYVGLQAGYSWGHAETNLGIDRNDEELDADGALVGGFVGYNFQFASPLVLGIEGDISWTGVDGSATDPIGGRYSVDENFEGAIRARIGYAFDRALLYAAGGVAFADTDTNVDETLAPRAHDSSKTDWGWTAGAGIDYALTDNVFVRGEYRYTDIADFDNEDKLGDLQDLQSHSVRLGVGVKF